MARQWPGYLLWQLNMTRRPPVDVVADLTQSESAIRQQVVWLNRHRSASPRSGAGLRCTTARCVARHMCGARRWRNEPLSPGSRCVPSLILVVWYRGARRKAWATDWEIVFGYIGTGL